MINVTVSMDEATAQWVRVESAKAGKSVSRWLGELLAERRRAETEGAEARRLAIEAVLATPLRTISDNGRLPTREELYDEVLRRHERPGVREGQAEPFEADAGAGVAEKPDGG